MLAGGELPAPAAAERVAYSIVTSGQRRARSGSGKRSYENSTTPRYGLLERVV